MKKVFFITALLLVLNLSMVWAEKENKSWDTRPHYETGLKGLLFTFSGLADLGALPYSGVGFKYYLNDSLGLRTGLGFSIDIDSANKLQGNTKEKDYKDTTYNILFNLGFQNHLVDIYNVSPYVGADILFGYDSTTHTPYEDDKENVDAKKKSSNMKIGVEGLLGFEYFFTKRISLGAEYKLGFMYGSYKEEVGGKETKSGNSINIGTYVNQNGALNLSVYF